MAELTLAELSKKFAKNHPEAGTLRYKKLVSKIENGEEFELTNGKTKILFYATPAIKRNFESGNLTALKGNKRLFKDMDDKIVRIDELEKTAEFGGGGGSGAGSDITELVESAQCLYCALVFYIFKRPMKLNEIVTPAQFERTKQYIDVSANFDDMVNKLPEDWVKSSILGANMLYSKYRGEQYIFHRGSSKVDTIENAFKAINRKEAAFGDINKWSPADIYMITRNFGVNKLNDEETLKGLNGTMMHMYLSKDCVGVSLKKMERRAQYSEVNLVESKGSNGAVSYKGMTIKANERSTIYDSMDIYIKYGPGAKERIQFRSFGTGDGLTGYQAEVKGETANQGKASLGPVSYIFKQHCNIILPKSSDIAGKVRRDDESICKGIYDMAKDLGVNNLPPYDEHKVRYKQQELKWKYSKYLGLLILTHLDAQTSDIKDKLVKDIYYYASSKSSFSAVYAKIEG